MTLGWERGRYDVNIYIDVPSESLKFDRPRHVVFTRNVPPRIESGEGQVSEGDIVREGKGEVG